MNQTTESNIEISYTMEGLKEVDTDRVRSRIRV